MSDKRFSQRVLHRDEVSIELITQSGQIIDCETVDVSATGIKLTTTHTLPTRSIQKVCIESSKLDKRLILIAEVKWVQGADNQKVLVGLEVQPAEEFDHDVWRALWQPNST
jgi:c-di-GMP-binding flagellar brake protein YcgR